MSQQSILKSSEDLATRYLEVLRNGMEEPLWNFSAVSGKPLVNTLFSDPNVSVILVKDQFGGTFIEHRMESMPEDPDASATVFKRAVVIKGSKEIGKIEIQFHFKDLHDQRMAIWRSSVIEIFLVLGTAIVILSFTLRQRLFAPLRLLSRHAGLLAQRKLEQPFAWTFTADELGRVNDAMDSARKHLAVLLEAMEVQNKGLQQAVDEKTSQLLQASKLSSLGEMAAGIAHEINNPLAIIVGSVNQLERKGEQWVDLESKNKVGVIARAADRISKIVKGLKSFARDDSHDAPERASLQDLLSLTLQFSGHTLGGGKIKLDVMLPPDSIYLSCRLTQLSQVLINLIQNAAHAIGDTVDPWIRIEAKRVDQAESRVVLTVTDSGRGIPSHVAAKMFDPFFTTKPIGKGTGLGLSISIGIIASHGGKLYLNPESPHTQFVIELPIEKQASLPQAA
jgi:C4-dicarboxylate-specific signal transduction histidine kinase